MAKQALYRRWRSQTFEEVVGQEHVTLTLRNALRDGRMSHAYLLTGPRGTGKTSTARILAKAINCLDDDVRARPCNHCHICNAISEGRLLDLIEIDAASNRGIDEIRDLREKIGFRPNEARYKVYIIDEVHMLTKEAFNALLKTLEEPPGHAIFVLATTEPDRVPETVRSRCQRFDFHRIPTHEIVEHLSEILKTEGSQAEMEALIAIARRATGSMRDAVSLLDQLLSYGDDRLTLARVENVFGLVNAGTVGRLVDNIAEHKLTEGLTLIGQLVAEGVELGELVDQIVAYLRGVLFLRVTKAPESLDLPQDIVAAMTRQAQMFSSAALLLALKEFAEARSALRDQVPGVPQLPIELAFMRAALPVAEAMVEPAAPGVRAAQAAPAVTAPAPAVPAVTPPTLPSAQPPATSSPAATRPAAEPVASHPAPDGRPAAAPARQEAASESDSAPTGDLLRVAQANWDRFLLSAGKRCGMKVQAALRSVREMNLVGQALVLQFSHAFSRDLVNQVENRTLVEDTWQEILGRRVPVRCVLVGENPAANESKAPAAAPIHLDEDQVLLEDARRRGAVVKPAK